MNASLSPWQTQFEGLGKPNGSKYWIEADVMEAFDYKSPSSWKNVINRAIQACMTIEIPVDQHFIQIPGGGRKLTRFACYLVAMNADSKKPQVAAAQVYLATLAESFQQACEHAEGVERVLIRSELADGQKALASTAKAHGVVQYPFFHNAGYLGMYNMNFRKLEGFKGLPDGQKLIDWMGKEELAANLFRITQTDAKIKNDGVHGQDQLERVAKDVGRKVRHTMLELSGTAPEDLPLAQPIQSIKKALKGADKQFRKIDSGKGRRPAKAASE
jgi:DNA-damage-inducible protein D